MHSFPPIKRTPDEVTSFVAAEIVAFQNPKLREAILECLVSPRSHIRLWNWSDPPCEHECWMIAESKTYDYGIVYSDFGFGPNHPWGLVFLSQDNFGADYCWYPRPGTV